MLDEKLDNLEIIHWPDPRLKIAGQRIEVFDQSLKSLATQMIALMNQAQGVGLAATQIGLDLQLFVARSPGQMDQPQVYINSELFEIGGTVVVRALSRRYLQFSHRHRSAAYRA